MKLQPPVVGNRDAEDLGFLGEIEIVHGVEGGVLVFRIGEDSMESDRNPLEDPDDILQVDPAVFARDVARIDVAAIEHDDGPVPQHAGRGCGNGIFADVPDAVDGDDFVLNICHSISPSCSHQEMAIEPRGFPGWAERDALFDSSPLLSHEVHGYTIESIRLR